MPPTGAYLEGVGTLSCVHWPEGTASATKDVADGPYGAQGCPVSETLIQQLRTSAARALGFCRAGVSTILRLSLSSPPEADPGFYQAVRVLMDFRRICRKQPQLHLMWDVFLQGFTGNLLQGPFSKLVEIFSELGWHRVQKFAFMDRDGQMHDLLKLPANLLRRVVLRDWLTMVAGKHQHRRSMQGLDTIDWDLCQLDKSRMSPLDQARIGAVQSGAFWTPHVHSKFDNTKSQVCRHCGVKDDVQHRLCECPRFEQHRHDVRWVLDLWSVLPPCTTHHLLAPQCEFQKQLRQELVALPSGFVFEQVPLDLTRRQFLFSDGSCFQHAAPGLCLASWAVVHANSNKALCAGQLSGELQTVPRAEITAVLCAVQWTQQMGCSTTLWCDAKHVVEGTVAVQAGEPIAPNGDNEDLWLQLRDALQLISEDDFYIRHVPSHMDSQLCEGPYEEWLAAHNHHADTAAVQANMNRSQRVMELHYRACRRFSHFSAILRALRMLFFRIAEDGPQTARLELHEDTEVSPPTMGVWEDETVTECLPLTWRQALSQVDFDVPREFVWDVWQVLRDWDAASETTFQVSWIELAFMFSSAGLKFPATCPSTGRWVPAGSVVFRPPCLTLAVQLRMVKRVLLACIRHLGIQSCLVGSIDLSGLGVTRPFDGLMLKVGAEVVGNARRRLRSFCLHRPIRVAADLARPL